MGRWDDDESIERSRQKAAESRKKLGESWSKIREGLERKAEREEEWQNTLDELTSSHDALDDLSESELEYYLIRAETEVEHLKEKSRAHGNIHSSLKSHAGGSPLSGLFDALSGIGTNALNSQIHKNEKLIRLIQARQRTLQKALPKSSRAEEMAQKMAEREQERQESIALLEQQRNAQKKKYPDQAASIDRRYRRMIDSILEEE